jgi:hypothetical protein
MSVGVTTDQKQTNNQSKKHLLIKYPPTFARILKLEQKVLNKHRKF